MILIGSKNDFQVYFKVNTQSYSVYKNGSYIIGNKYSFSDVKSYLD